MEFNYIYGNINAVSLSVYDKLILKYVNIVKKVKGVVSIIQIGSFSAPGLSDIDIIVIVDDNDPPKWKDISILKILGQEEGAEVIAHDVFVYPKSIAKYIEGLFYLDRKKVLFGDDIGEYMTEEKINDLKLILTYEYTVHRLESLIAMLSIKKNHIRSILLFISTLRHTYKLLSDFNIISVEESEQKIIEIEVLRKKAIENRYETLKAELNNWILPSFTAIYSSILLLNKKLSYSKANNNKWILNYRKIIFNIDSIEEASLFFLKNDAFNKRSKGRILMIPMPSAIQEHIVNYKKRNYFDEKNFDEINLKMLRYNLAKRHETFIKSNNYPIAKSYIITEDKEIKLKDRVKYYLCKVILLFKSYKYKYKRT